MIRVVIADDQALVRGGFRMILEAERDIIVVGEAADGHDALAAVREHAPDVLLLDIRMPSLDGLEVARRLARSDSPTRILVLTTFDVDDYVYEALAAGASGFLLKDVPSDELAAGVRVVARGDALLAPSITRRLIERHVQERHREREPVSLADLTARECEVLELVARGLSNAEIATTLFLGETTVKTHVGRLLRKLGARDRAQLVVAAYEAGLVTPARDA